MSGSFSCNMKPNKKEKERTQLTAGGDRINYPEDVGTPTTDMTLVKILLNSVTSTTGAKCILLDLKDFYLNTPMKRYEYICLKISGIPKEIIQEYNLQELVTEDGYVYCKICKGMYGLPQTDIIAQELLQERLAKVRYHQSKIISGQWTHVTTKTCFTLVVDDFAIKYTNLEHAKHLISVLQKDYTVTIDWDATKYIVLTIEWDYTNHKVYAHMPGYLSKALIQFNHTLSKEKQTHCTHTLLNNMEPKRSMQQRKMTPPPYIQAVAGTLLYYGGAVNNTILPALSAIATEQANRTEKTMETIKQFLDYCATQEAAQIFYKARKMILAVHSNAGYCNEKKLQSRAGGIFFLTNDNKHPPNKGAILTIATIINAVMT
jgi:hypothetical protein